MTSRRNFLGILGAGAALPAMAPGFPAPDPLQPVSSDYDMSWVDRLTSQRRAVFDSPEIEDGTAVFRAVFWRQEYADVYGLAPGQVDSVLVLRHKAIVLAMNDSFWSRFEIGKKFNVNGMDGKPLANNPSATPDPKAPKRFRAANLQDFMASGGIVLGCGLAFSSAVVPRYRRDGVKGAAVREAALADLLPGVILQPSGFFATLRAQEAGCWPFFN